MQNVHDSQRRLEGPPTTPGVLEVRPRRAWILGALGGVLGAAGLGVAIAALLSVPVVGPTGSRGATGPAGVAGVAGPAGPRGATGPVGPAGTIKSTVVESGTTLVSQPDPPVGTVLVGDISCPTNTVLLSGDGTVAAPGPDNLHVAIRSSFPVNDHEWQVVAIVQSGMGPGNTVTMRPFALCGTI